MSNIVRSDPFDVAFRDFFRNMLRPTRLELETEPEIRLDLKEADNAYTVHAEIPGVKKEDIDVSIDGNLVSIRAEVRRQKEEKGEAMLRSERSSASPPAPSRWPARSTRRAPPRSTPTACSS